MIEPPKVDLILAPTPLVRLQRASKDLGIDLWIKRDDLTGFAFGGNKGRKLEFIVAEAMAKAATLVVTCGSTQSNFVRQLAAACAVNGLKCAAATMPLPYEFDEPLGGLADSNGNTLLNELLGADIRILPNGTWDALYKAAADLAQEFRDRGEAVYEVPIGGSSPLGAYAFYRAGLEVQAQTAEPFDKIIFASSSGSTHTGLLYAYAPSATKIVGVACDPEPEILDDFRELYSGLEALTGEPRPISADRWSMDWNFVGEGYGIPSEAGMHAIEYLARKEGIFLDPIYSGKAFAYLLHRAVCGDLPGRTLFWHTGGTPALFAIE